MLLDALPGVSLLNGISPDEVIALGAAEQVRDQIKIISNYFNCIF